MQIVLDFFNDKNFNPDDGKEFYEYYEDRQWQTSDGSDVRDWRALAKYWVEQKSLMKEKNRLNKKQEVSHFRDNLRTTKNKDYGQPL